ncbi:hypothetical protein [Actinoplanes sp. NPDC020271]|uniref:hypothetical protein n=1 Tax=Actinoplanes sp. NPDC020271 TaxID=3363896 RepID=UPI0037A15826
MTGPDLEQRLRAALSARAAAVTHQHLRHDLAPRRRSPARWWLPLTAGLAAAAVSITAFLLLHPVNSEPPAAPPPPSPATSPPAPSLSVPTAGPTPTASAPRPTAASTPSASGPAVGKTPR